MSDFVNTIDLIGDESLTDMILERSIIEYKDNEINLIGTSAFMGCTELNTVNVPLATKLNDYAFCDCSVLNNINIPLTTSVGQYAFQNCSNLSIADMPLVTSVGGYAFNNCSSLSTANFPNITSIDQYTFQNCSKLVNANYPLLESIGKFAFNNCSSLTSINAPKATAIGEYAFQNCSNLVSVDFPLVTTLTTCLFNKSGLVSVNLPNVTSIDAGAFQNCSNLVSVDFPLVTTLNRSSIFSECSSLTSVNIPNATAIGSSVFRKTGLVSANFPNVTSIGSNAFQECYSLESVNMPNVTTIASSGFERCENLQSIVLPSVTKIDAYALRYCSALAVADFPSVTEIGANGFLNCPSLYALIIRNTSGVCTLGYNVFGGSRSLRIYVPRALVDSYKSATNWSNLASKIRALEYYTVDGTITGDLIDDAANKHIVRFYNSDGTLLGYQVVVTGESATYAGTPVSPSDANAQFIGFEPSPTNVTADMDCYATYKDAWSDVFASIDDGTYKTKYAIGDTVPLSLGSEGVINMQIVAFDTDDLADGSGKAPITWSAATINTEHRMNPDLVTNGDGTYQEGTGNIGGWEKCELRAYLKNTIKPMMPKIVRNAIKEVTKSQDAYDTSGTKFVQTTTDDVWIPSRDEGRSSKYSFALLRQSWTRTVSDSSYNKFVRTANDSFGGSITNASNTLEVLLCFCT